ncbi:hexosaminidase D-like [Battus philenor]|uniref:hexosaminidase D-like n=1 Tax=Battus philenor TaxID=42288 RepID=UPI0035CEAE40
MQVTKMHKIVHFDLKGAPLQITYLESVFKNIKSWGATAVLLEWEDTFPYTSTLKDIGSQSGNNGSGGDGLYSTKDVQRIFKLANENNLEVIQLIQTIGHMEYVLKHPSLRSLREMSFSPAVLCPSKPESLQLATSMLEQALDAQPDASFIHIGADEVWHTAVCEECQRRASGSQHKTASLYLDHIQNVILFLKQKKPDLTVLMWEDMLRSMNMETLKWYRLGDLVQPVVWHYNPKECFQLQSSMWDMYRQVFNKVWIASAFKGANGGCQVLSPVARYVSNHEGWLLEIEKYSSDINFVGIILTGWSRYDHYATLCELLPVSLPSLKTCLQILSTGKAPEAVSEVIPEEEWPGVELARCVHSYLILRERSLAFIHGDVVSTWMNPWQLKNEYTNPLQLENIVVTSKHLLAELLSLQKQTSVHLHAITGRRSAEEWTGTFLTPLVQRMKEIHETADNRFKINASVQPKCVIESDMELGR